MDAWWGECLSVLFAGCLVRDSKDPYMSLPGPESHAAHHCTCAAPMLPRPISQQMTLRQANCVLRAACLA